MHAPRDPRPRSIASPSEFSGLADHGSKRPLCQLRRSNADDCAARTIQKTRTTPTEVTVFYPYHPLHDRRLEVYSTIRDSSIFVVTIGRGRRLQIPAWMTSPEAALFQIVGRAVVAAGALLMLCDLIDAIALPISEPGMNDRRCESNQTRTRGQDRARANPTSTNPLDAPSAAHRDGEGNRRGGKRGQRRRDGRRVRRGGRR
jgi:hypothetical protein